MALCINNSLSFPFRPSDQIWNGHLTERKTKSYFKVCSLKTEMLNLEKSGKQVICVLTQKFSDIIWIAGNLFHIVLGTASTISFMALLAPHPYIFFHPKNIPLDVHRLEYHVQSASHILLMILCHECKHFPGLWSEKFLSDSLYHFVFLVSIIIVALRTGFRV